MGRVYTTTGIELINVGGTTIIDSHGILSSPNFSHDGTIVTTNFETTNISDTRITGVVLSFVTERANTRVLISYFAEGLKLGHGTSGLQGLLKYRENDSNILQHLFSGIYNIGVVGDTLEVIVSNTLVRNFASAGTHTIELKTAQFEAGTMSVSQAGINYVILGT